MLFADSMLLQAETAEAEDEDDSDAEGAALRKLQQLLPDPNDGYTQAARLIFTNIFDFFRANGETCRAASTARSAGNTWFLCCWPSAWFWGKAERPS